MRDVFGGVLWLGFFLVVVGFRYLRPNFANSIRPRKR